MVQAWEKVALLSFRLRAFIYVSLKDRIFIFEKIIDGWIMNCILNPNIAVLKFVKINFSWGAVSIEHIELIFYVWFFKKMYNCEFSDVSYLE